MIPARSCGGCTACCEFLWVEEVDAPAGQPCRHQCAEGCGIYGSPERPPVCGGFFCLYAQGDADVPFRPDQCGVMVWRDSGEIRLRELRFFALEESWVRSALRAWRHESVVMERL